MLKVLLVATKLAGSALLVGALFWAGAAVTPNGADLRILSGATWLRGGITDDPVSWRHPGWYAWPGWQRVLVRFVLVATAAGWFAAPMLVTGLVVGAVSLGSAGAALARSRRRQARQLGARRVRSQVAR